MICLVSKRKYKNLSFWTSALQTILITVYMAFFNDQPFLLNITPTYGIHKTEETAVIF